MSGREEIEDGAFEGWSRWPWSEGPSFHDAIGPFQWERRSFNTARCPVETAPMQGNGYGALLPRVESSRH